VPVLSLSLSGGSRYLCSSGVGNCISLWDLKDRNVVRTFDTLADSVPSISFNDGETVIAAGTSSSLVKLFHISSGKLQTTLSQGEVGASVNKLEYSKVNKDLLAAAHCDGSVVLWNTSTGAMHSRMTIHHTNVNGLSFSPVNKLLLCSGGEDGRVIFYDVDKSNKVVKEIKLGSSVTSVAFYQDGVSVLVGDAKGEVYLYDLRNASKSMLNFQAHSDVPVRDVRFHRVSDNKSKRSTSSVKTPTHNSHATPQATPASSKFNAKGLHHSVIFFCVNECLFSY
jgi:WD40 repeat protein